jgi:hypothetical protein
MNKKQQQKRAFLRKVAYVVPAVLTLKAIPSFASVGSGSNGKPATPSGFSNPRRKKP